MKRKNILWGFVLLLVAMAFCYACTSCGDDKQEEPQPSNPLLGAWEAVIDEALCLSWWCGTICHRLLDSHRAGSDTEGGHPATSCYQLADRRHHFALHRCRPAHDLYSL